MTTTTAAGKGGIYALAEPLWPRYANARERSAARLPSFAALRVVLRTLASHVLSRHRRHHHPRFAHARRPRGLDHDVHRFVLSRNFAIVPQT